MPSSPPLAVVCAWLIRDGRVLAARKGPGKRMAGQWEFPGGKIEAGESPGAALQRELREELDLEVRILGPGGRHLHRYDFGDIALEAWWCAPCELSDPCGKEHDAMRWCLPAELDALDWCPADRPLMQALRTHLQSGNFPCPPESTSDNFG